MNKRGNISESDFSGLKKSFGDDFTASVMDRVNAEVQGSKSKTVKLLSNLAIVAAAACIVLIAYIGFTGEGEFDTDSFMGLSEYSDFDLQETGYFEDE